MAWKLSDRSAQRLIGVHGDLVRVIRKALELSPLDFAVLEGLRTPERQRELLASGASQTLRSRHLTGHAVDLAPIIGGEIRWDWPPYYRLAEAVKAAADAENVRIEWGGDWRQFKDGPHWQLPWKDYP